MNHSSDNKCKMANEKCKIRNGFTLVELIISITITAIIMVGVSAFFASSFHNIFTTQEKLDESQGQFATNEIIRSKLAGIEEVIDMNTSDIVVRNNTDNGDLPFTYIGDNGGKLVFKDFFVFNGMYENYKSSNFKAKIPNPGGITKVGSYYYITAPLENKIYKCSSTSDCSVFLESGLDHPIDVTTDGTSLFVSDPGNDRVVKIDMSNNITELPFELNFPTGVAYDSVNGELFVSNIYNNRVIRIYDNGSKMSVIVGEDEIDTCDNTAKPCKLNFPTGLAIDPVTKSLYIADTGNSRILKITDPKEISEYDNNDPYEIKLTILGDQKVSKINFTFPVGTDVSKITEISNTLHKGKYESAGNVLSMHLEVPLANGAANNQICTEEGVCTMYFSEFTVITENNIFDNNDDILIGENNENNRYEVSSINSNTIIVSPNKKHTNSYSNGTIIKIENTFNRECTFKFDLSTSNLPTGFNTIKAEAYDENGDIIESSTATQILRVGDGIIGTAEDTIIEVNTNNLYYPTGLGFDNGLKITTLDENSYDTDFPEYDYESNFELEADGLEFSEPNTGVLLQVDIETTNEDTYVINSAL